MQKYTGLFVLVATAVWSSWFAVLIAINRDVPWAREVAPAWTITTYIVGLAFPVAMIGNAIKAKLEKGRFAA